MMILYKPTLLRWFILFLAGLFYFFPAMSPGQSPDRPADSLVQLSDMRVIRTPPGQEAYVRYCAFCHGNEGRGDGLNAFNLNIRPRDFTDTLAMKNKTKSSIKSAISQGGAVHHLSSDMPPWARTLDPVIMEWLSDYILGSFPDRGSPGPGTH
jgi:mono/diheme cytochrome c family protein